MKAEELAFFNQQLAGMLKSGIPLEGALSEINRDLGNGKLKQEVEKLQQTLSSGTDLSSAIAQTNFPPLYKKVLQVGAKSENINQILILLADYYQRSSLLWNRFRTIILYPFLVLTTAFGVSCFLAYSFSAFAESLTLEQNPFLPPQQQPFSPELTQALISLTPIVFGSLLLAALGLLIFPSWRARALWFFPGLKEASLAQTASISSLLLKSGVPFSDAIQLLSELQTNKATKHDLNNWSKRHAEGEARFANLAKGSRAFPPLFVWLVSSSGEAITEGFEKAATLYQRRADYRAELFLVAAVPISLLFTVLLLIVQAFPMVRFMTSSLNALDSF